MTRKLTNNGPKQDPDFWHRVEALPAWLVSKNDDHIDSGDRT